MNRLTLSLSPVINIISYMKKLVSMKRIIFLFLFITAFESKAQSVIPIDRYGKGLQSYYRSMDVEHHWLAGTHINWETGVADKPDATSGIATHCSAFAAAACENLGVYLLRPPEHPQVLLANAQYNWLASPAALAANWQPVSGDNSYEAAQTRANNGFIVIAICKNPISNKPGHVALVIPAEVSSVDLAAAGPLVIMAGTHNYTSIPLNRGFKSHITEWPEHAITFYFNTKRFAF